jgi:hypothetical protein
MKASIRIDVSDLPDEKSEETSGDDSSQMKRRFWYVSPAQLPSIHDRRVYPVYTGRWLELSLVVLIQEIDQVGGGL